MEEKSLDQYKYESLCRQMREACDFGNATDAEVMTGWHIVDVVEGEKTRRCLCGFDEIRTYYIVENRKIRHGICPIGSDCLRFFGMENLEAERIALWCIYNPYTHKALYPVSYPSDLPQGKPCGFPDKSNSNSYWHTRHVLNLFSSWSRVC